MQQENVSNEAALPAGFSMRAPTLDDAEDIAVMMNAQTEYLAGRSSYSTEIVLGILSTPSLDLNDQVRIILNSDNEVVAALIVYNHQPHIHSGLDFRIHPDYEEGYPFRQILMEWGEALAKSYINRAPMDAQVSLGTSVYSKDKNMLAYVETAGFEHIRNFYRMGIDLDQNIPEAQFPAGITLKTATEVNDLRKVYRAIDEAFQDHWGYVAEDEDEAVAGFQHWINSQPNVDTDYWYVAMDSDEIAGVAICLPYLVGLEHIGSIDNLGVRPKWRRQGMALALLRHSFHALRQLGREQAVLHVDAESLTGATRLYEKAGMKVVEQTLNWEKILREGKDLRKQLLED